MRRQQPDVERESWLEEREREAEELGYSGPVWYDHMPYIEFPENWPVFSPKDKVGDWLEMDTRVMELNYRSSTEAKSASYDDEKQEWTVTVERDGQPARLRPVHRLTEVAVVLADGTEAPGRRRRLRHRLQLDEPAGRELVDQQTRRQGRQGLGPRLGHREGPRALGGIGTPVNGFQEARHTR